MYIDSFRSLNQKNKMFIALFGLTLELGIQAKFIFTTRNRYRYRDVARNITKMEKNVLDSVKNKNRFFSSYIYIYIVYVCAV